jgi:hypothetical protein
MNKYYCLFLDDERYPKNVTWIELPLEEWVIVRSFDEFVKYIQENGVPAKVSFDHDLGESAYKEMINSRKNNEFDYNNVSEKTGYHAAIWLANYCVSNKLSLPVCFIHTMNPIGAMNIKSVIDSYHKSVIISNTI